MSNFELSGNHFPVGDILGVRPRLWQRGEFFRPNVYTGSVRELHVQEKEEVGVMGQFLVSA